MILYQVESLAWDHWMSSSANVSATTNSSRPSQPVDIAVTMVGEREAVLAWSQPDHGARWV